MQSRLRKPGPCEPTAWCLSFPISLYCPGLHRLASQTQCPLELSSWATSCVHHTVPTILKSPSGPFLQTPRRTVMPDGLLKGTSFGHRSLFVKGSHIPRGEESECSMPSLPGPTPLCGGDPRGHGAAPAHPTQQSTDTRCVTWCCWQGCCREPEQVASDTPKANSQQ